ncbi:MAG: hypothetical protein LBQ14_07840 [Treponema sp.]|jgi:hypothetical protein|nr:hypothetical protein [Treponema sp.]
MKGVIELLETARKKFSFVDAGIVYTVCEEPFRDGCKFLESAISSLKARSPESEPAPDNPDDWEPEDISGEKAPLKKLWEEFFQWDNGAKGTNDDEAERYAKHKGAVDYQIIAFMAFVEGRACGLKEAENEM